MIFEFTHAERPVSSWVSGVYYNEHSYELAVTTRGTSYIYRDVPFAEFEDFSVAKSAGYFYNNRIQGMYVNKWGRGLEDYEVSFKSVNKKPVVEQKKFVVRATVEFEAEVSAGSLDEAVKAFLESNKDVPGIKIQEVVVPFGE